ncbi:MAG: carboxypeptidase regulatory-like domain-containing protein [Acidobacteria bacterium]|nr:carboxypeptidase regulatory-like domain-containing protein [Acidobacteriota bacterium]
MGWVCWIGSLAMGAMAALAQKPVPNTGGTIIGTVVGEDGKGLAGVSVTVLREMLTDIGAYPPASAGAQTRANGGFAFQGLGPGTYRLCAQLPFTAMLHTCNWETSVDRVRIVNNEIRAGVKLVMKRGMLLKIKVEDPGGHLERNVGKTKGAMLTVGLAEPRKKLMVLPVMSRDKASWNYQTAVPYGRAVQLHAKGGFFSLADGNGRSIDQRNGAALAAPGQQEAERQVVIRVNGPK